MADLVIEIPDEVCGPAMQALSDDRQRMFAYLMGMGESNATKAARESGYSDANGAARVRAHYLMHRETIQAAIREVSSKALMGLAPLAVGAARAVLATPSHPAHARMIETILDRTGFSAKTEHTVTVEHRASREQLVEWAKQYAIERGLAPEALLPGPKVIEHDEYGTAPAMAAVKEIKDAGT